MAHWSASPTFAQRVLVAASIVALVAIVVVLLASLAEVMMLVFAGALLAVFLDGLASALSRHTPLPRGVSLALVCLALLALAGGFGWFVGPQLVAQLGALGERLPVAVSSVLGWLEQHDWADPIVARLRSPGELVSSFAREDVVGQVTGAFSSLFGVLAGALLVGFIGLYLAVNPGLYVDNALKLVPSRRRPRAGDVVQQLGRALRLWLVARLASMVVIGALTAIGLQILGVPLALALGVIAGLLSFIPYIGPILAFAPAGLIALSESPTTLLYALILYAVAQLLESYLITPIIERRVVQLPPALVITVQVIMGVLLGLLGMFLATPVAVIAIVLVQMLYVEDVLHDDVQVLGDDG